MRQLRHFLPLICLLALPATAAPPPRLSAPEATVANFVAQLLESQHLRQRPIDDALSAEWLDLYLEGLDPERLFFTAADIAEFSRYKNRLDDAIRQVPADTTPAFLIHDRLRTRVHERVDAAVRMLADPAKLPRKGTMEPDRSEAPWAADAKALDELWARRLSEQLSRSELNGEEAPAIAARLTTRYKEMARDIDDLDGLDVLEAWLGGLGAAYDPHSVWFKPTSKADFDMQMSDSLEGIGATLRLDGEYIKVESLVPGGPADRGSQLHPGDRIVAVTQADGSKVDTVGMRTDRVVKLIRGPKGTEVTLTVIPVEATDPSDVRPVKIMRDKVIIAEAAAKLEIKEQDGVKVGVIDVPSFYQEVQKEGRKAEIGRSTASDVRKLLEESKSKGVQVVVIDLRENGGGALGQAIELTGLFIDAGPVVQIKGTSEHVEVMADEQRGVAWAGPLVLLTSPHSASASEIFAGAIQDYRRGLVVGSATTHGKGSVQNYLDLAPFLSRMVGNQAVEVAGALKFTTSRFYRISGRSPQEAGVQADVVIPSPSDGLPTREADLKNALPYDEIPPARFTPMPAATDIARLQRRSLERIKQDPAFQLMDEMRTLRDSRENQPIPLDLETRRAELNTWKSLEERAKSLGLDDGKRDPVLDETLRLCADLLQG
jgi:carboxyl-terminal processing protease